MLRNVATVALERDGGGRAAGPGGGPARRGAASALGRLADHLELLVEATRPLPGREEPAHTAFQTHLRRERVGALDRLEWTTRMSFWCFSPGVAMNALAESGPRSIVLTSGTLSPLSSFAQELCMEFPVRLENDHVIAARQVWAGVVGTGPAGGALNSSYQTRESPAYKRNLGNAIVNFCRIVPDGLLVFFPSYSVMDSLLSAWRGGGDDAGGSVWERICRLKHTVTEPRDSGAFPDAVAQFRAFLAAPAGGCTGAVFFAVCRGKASEGLDFADHAGRAVVVTGIPFPMTRDPKVEMKRAVLDKAARAAAEAAAKAGRAAPGRDRPLTGEEWYLQQASRAVNQAIGRVIRHKDDFGAIVFLDERFARRDTAQALSRWVRPLLRPPANFGKSAAALKQFFNAMAAGAGGAGGAGGGGGAGAAAVPAGAATVPAESFTPRPRGGGARDPGAGPAAGAPPRTLTGPAGPAVAAGLEGLASLRRGGAGAGAGAGKAPQAVGLLSMLSQGRGGPAAPLPGAGGVAAAPAANELGVAGAARAGPSAPRGPPAPGRGAGASGLTQASRARGGPPAPGAPPAAGAEARTKAFLATAQALLGRAELREMLGVLRDYQARRVSILDTARRMVPLLRGRGDLLARFEAFVPRAEKGEYARMVDERRGAEAEEEERRAAAARERARRAMDVAASEAMGEVVGGEGPGEGEGAGPALAGGAGPAPAGQARARAAPGPAPLATGYLPGGAAVRAPMHMVDPSVAGRGPPGAGRGGVPGAAGAGAAGRGRGRGALPPGAARALLHGRAGAPAGAMSGASEALLGKRRRDGPPPAPAPAPAPPANPCRLCRRGAADKPYRGTCGCVACFACWSRELAGQAGSSQKRCPACGRPASLGSIERVPIAAA